MSSESDDKTVQNIPISGGRRTRKSGAQAPAEAAPVAGEQATESSTSAADTSIAADSAAQATNNARARAESAEYRPDYDAPRRKSAEARPGSFNPLAWLVEGATGFVEEARHGDLGLSEEFWKHFYATRRESLLTARALIDSLLEQTEKDAQKAQEKTRRAQQRGSIPLSGSLSDDKTTP